MTISKMRGTQPGVLIPRSYRYCAGLRWRVLLLVVFCLGLSTPAWAGMFSWSAAFVDFGQFTLPTNAHIGDTLATRNFDVSLRSSGVRTPTTVSLYLQDNALHWDRSVAGGVWQTAVPGVGIQLLYNGVTAVTPDNIQNPLGNPVSLSDGSPLTASFTMKLVLTGPVLAGHLPPTRVIRLAASINGQLVYDRAPISARAAFAQPTCVVTRTPVIVSLTTVAPAALAYRGATAGRKSFTLSATCPVGTTHAQLIFDDKSSPGTAYPYVTNSSYGTATHVAVQILDANDRPVAMHTPITVSNPSGDGIMNIRMSAQYLATGPASAGSVRAIAVYTLLYP